jgi:hypothetical protein
MNNKAHLSSEGFQKIVNIRASINLGLSKFQKSEILNVSPIQRPLIETKERSNPHWLSGFVSGEVCFYINISKSKTHKIGYSVGLKFILTQHDRDKILFELIIKYLGCGKLYKRKKERAVTIEVYRFSEITNIIIPFFFKHTYFRFKTKRLSWLMCSC